MNSIKENNIAIIQARMSSSRLPGKVLREIGDRAMLDWVVTRSQRAQCLTKVVVATTIDPTDDPIAEHCAKQGYIYTRGSLHDVLDRYYQAARAHNAQNIIRITADCPLIDPVLIDHTFAEFKAAGADFAANRLPSPWGRTYPIGLDTEIATFAALETTWQEAQAPHQREHVMPYLYENADRFKIVLVNHVVDHGNLRWTVDTPEDLELLQQITARFAGRDNFSWLEVLALFEQEPDLQQINAGIHHKTVTEVDERRHS